MTIKPKKQMNSSQAVAYIAQETIAAKNSGINPQDFAGHPHETIVDHVLQFQQFCVYNGVCKGLVTDPKKVQAQSKKLHKILNEILGIDFEAIIPVITVQPAQEVVASTATTPAGKIINEA
jgi:hypothetical protein